MSHAIIDDILDRIKRLPDEDRLLLDELLAQQEDQEWWKGAAKPRKVARERESIREPLTGAVHAERHGEEGGR